LANCIRLNIVIYQVGGRQSADLILGRFLVRVNDFSCAPARVQRCWQHGITALSNPSV